MDFEARRILVTGGSLGIGLEVSRELARRGARVIVAARGIDAIEAAIDALDGTGHDGISLDVSNPRAWQEAAARIDAGGGLHGLVTAAGILGPIGALDHVRAADLIETLAINLVGTVLAVQFALPRLRASGGRAVTFSGGGGTSPLPRYDAYSASKAAVVRVTENVAADGEIEINAVAPGFVATRMHDGTLRAGPEAAGQSYYDYTRQQLRDGGFPPSEAAELVAFLLGPEAAGISGRLISAQWDPWRQEDFRERLRNDSDLAKLRRIDAQFFTRLPRRADYHLGWAPASTESPAGRRRPVVSTDRAAVFVDRDGVINELVPDPVSGRPESPLRVADVHLIAGAAAALRGLAAAGWRLVGVSNQPSAAKGLVRPADLHAIQERVLELLDAEGARFDDFRLCLHHPSGLVPELTGECDCRKPRPGMLLAAADELGIDLGRSWMVGDTDGDMQAGRSAGCRTILVEHPRSAHKRTAELHPDAVVRDLAAAAGIILAVKGVH